MEDYRGAAGVLLENRGMGKLDKGPKLTSLFSRISIKATSRLLACSLIPAVVLSNAGVALYPKDKILDPGRSNGRKSRSHSLFDLGSVQVLRQLPLRPWTATMLLKLV